MFAFARELNDQHVYVVLNRSDQAQSVEIPVKGGSFVDWLNPEQAVLTAADGKLPTVSIAKDAKKLAATGGVLKIDMKPYTAAVLTAD